MSLTIDATVGDAAANSYVTEAEMTAYCEGRLQGATWTGADAQLPALVEATRDLTRLAWKGVRVDLVQALAWPRTGVVNPDDPDQGEFDDDVIPQRVKDATCELALQYLLAGTDPAAVDANAAVIRKKVDVLETEYAAPVLRPQGLARYPRVIALVAPLTDNFGAGNIRLGRV